MPEYATLNVSKQDRLATVTIDNGRVNAIDTALSRDLESAFLDLGGDGTVGGVVLAGKPHCFCAGLDVKMLATSDKQGLRDFFSAYLSALQTMVRFDKPLVAAVTGYAPAGGTIIALTADYRVMGRGSKHTLGMNEFNMSLQIPRMMGDIFAYYLGEPAAWANVQNARMYDSEASLALGLVNESVEVEEVIERAEAHCRKLMQVHYPVFKRTKHYLRRGLLAVVDHEVEEMVDTIEEDFDDPVFQQMTKMFLASLK
ncbi:enoyl-CoA hydratase/carnithine racemase [Lewinella aquimaris]|uniref:Enoyl-CoA hydratase/carnithine racemase n=1 Tax=Neolewinella aquimaris TaxID=1835722 RepID=A0A840E464_9BACT|nr:enoyl-CoA hydratase/isomerase family protein [Neolewinella aquimaris]MBB4078532.1 enoyl-CoA hydratase/carnithine racemase [Neolewinella aquimaris]